MSLSAAHRGRRALASALRSVSAATHRRLAVAVRVGAALATEVALEPADSRPSPWYDVFGSSDDDGASAPMARSTGFSPRDWSSAADMPSWPTARCVAVSPLSCAPAARSAS
ncbi:hypothetical protein ACX31A_09000 [Dermacoccus nishinomiyaensis]